MSYHKIPYTGNKESGMTPAWFFFLLVFLIGVGYMGFAQGEGIWTEPASPYMWGLEIAEPEEKEWECADARETEKLFYQTIEPEDFMEIECSDDEENVICVFTSEDEVQVMEYALCYKEPERIKKVEFMWKDAHWKS